jgi:PAT family beta-lactamase induction signal transducer AmpG
MQAYRIELFKAAEEYQGNFLNVLGFRIGLVISGVFGLYLASFLGWTIAFYLIAACIVPCIVVICFSDEKKVDIKQFCFKSDFSQPLLALAKIPNLSLIILAISFYKVSDSYLDAMFIPFLLEVGYSKVQIAEVAQTVGMAATIAGAAIGSFVAKKKNVIQKLIVGEVLAALSNLLFISLNNTHDNIYLLTGLVCIESFSSGVCGVLLINYMSALCDKEFTATHYAAFVSLAGFTRTLISSTSGWVVDCVGWNDFFIISALFSLPSLFCLYCLKGASAK